MIRLAILVLAVLLAPQASLAQTDDLFEGVRVTPVLTPASGASAAPRAGPAGGAQSDRRTGAPVDEHAALRKAFDGLPSPVGNGSARLLADNMGAWHARWAMLDRASSTIDTTYFIFDHDVFGASLLGNLYRHAARGRQVRLMIDASGDSAGSKGFKATGRGQDYLQELVNTGNAQVRTYHPYFKKLPGQVADIVRDGFGTSVTGMASNHDKILVVDKKWAVTGGRNISLNYFVDAGDFPECFRDTDVLLDSPGASAELTKAFELEFTRDDLTFAVKKEKFGSWMKRDLELISAYLMMDIWLKGPKIAESVASQLRSNKGAREPYVDELLRAVENALPGQGIARNPGRWDNRNLREWADQLVGYPLLRGQGTGDAFAGMRAGTAIKVLDRTSAAGSNPEGLNDDLVALVSGARVRILIQNPYVVLSRRAIEALGAASAHGVEIMLMTNSPASTDSALTQAFFLEAWPEVLARVPRLRIFVMTGKRKLHAKCAVIDDIVSVVSTYNLDFISAHVNSEVGVAAWSGPLAADVIESFRADMAAPSNDMKEYTIEKNADGSPVVRGGKPVVKYGAANHLDPKVWDRYKTLRKGADRLQDLLPQLAPLR